MSAFNSFLPENQHPVGDRNPLFPRVNNVIRAAFNIAFAGLASFVIVGAAACAVRLVFER